MLYLKRDSTLSYCNHSFISFNIFYTSYFQSNEEPHLNLCLGSANLYIIHKPISKLLVTLRALFFVFLNNTLQGTSLTRKYHAQSCCNKWSRDQFLSGVVTLSFLRFLKLQGAFLVILSFSEILNSALKEFTKHTELFMPVLHAEKEGMWNDTGNGCLHSTVQIRDL